MRSKKKAPVSKKKPHGAKKKGAPAKASKRPAADLDTPDMTLALPKPLAPDEIRVLTKMGDADRAIAARCAKVLLKHEDALAIPGVRSAPIMEAIRRTEEIVPSEAAALRQHSRLVGARLVADDLAWKSVTKLHRRLLIEGHDLPGVMDDFAFLMEYFANRSRKIVPTPKGKGKPPARGSGSPRGGEPAPAQGA